MKKIFAIVMILSVIMLCGCNGETPNVGENTGITGSQGEPTGTGPDSSEPESNSESNPSADSKTDFELPIDVDDSTGSENTVTDPSETTADPTETVDDPTEGPTAGSGNGGQTGSGKNDSGAIELPFIPG